MCFKILDESVIKSVLFLPLWLLHNSYAFRRVFRSPVGSRPRVYLPHSIHPDAHSAHSSWLLLHSAARLEQESRKPRRICASSLTVAHFQRSVRHSGGKISRLHVLTLSELHNASSLHSFVCKWLTYSPEAEYLSAVCPVSMHASQSDWLTPGCSGYILHTVTASVQCTRHSVECKIQGEVPAWSSLISTGLAYAYFIKGRVS